MDQVERQAALREIRDEAIARAVQEVPGVTNPELGEMFGLGAERARQIARRTRERTATRRRRSA